MDKLKYIKLENEDGTYSDSIPLSVDSNYIDVNSSTGATNLMKYIGINDINISTLKNTTTSLNNKISSLINESPLVVSSISEMLDITKIYINITDGYWYYYDGNDWVSGGQYLETGVNEIINSVTDCKIFKFENVSNLDSDPLLYNIKEGVQYEIEVETSGISYSANSTSFCLQYYDNTNESWVDLIRLKGNIAVGKNKYYKNIICPEIGEHLRLVVHSTTATDINISIKSLNLLYYTNERATGKDIFIKYPIEKNKTYLFKIELDKYNSALPIDSSSQPTVSVWGIKGTNEVGDDHGETFYRMRKMKDLNLLNTCLYLTFVSLEDYTYLHFYNRLNIVPYEGIKIYDLTDSDEADLYFKNLNKNNVNELNQIRNNGLLEIDLTKENIEFNYGKLKNDGSVSTNEYFYSCCSERFQFSNDGDVKFVFDDSLYTMKLGIFDNNLNFISLETFSTSFIYTINKNYYYKIEFTSLDTEEVFSFNSPIKEGLINFYYIQNKKMTEFKKSKIFDSINSLKTPYLYAHRGYQAEAPENSIPAFKLAGEYGFWGIETDFYSTSDGVIVCMHDSTIDRMTDGTGSIASMTYDELNQYHIDTGPNIEQYTEEELRIPTIDDYLSICRYYGMVPFIEIKTDVVQAVVQKVKDYGLEDFAIMSSFEWGLLIKTRQLSNMYLHWIRLDTSDTHIDDLEEMGNAGRSFNYTNLDNVPAELNATMNNKGLGYCFRAADTIEAVKKQIELGLTYIPTNSVKPSQLQD